MTDRTLHAHESEDAVARLRRSFEDGLAGHAIATRDGRIIACNPEFARVIGVDSVESAMAVNLHELEPRPGAFLSLVRRLAESPLIPLEELQLIRRDGTPSRVLARLAATADDAGQVTEIRVYLVDITELKAAEESHRFLAQASAALEAALDVNAAAATLARVGVPRFAEFCLVDLLREDGSLRRAAAAHVHPALESALEPDAIMPANADTGSAPLRAVATGEVECIGGGSAPADYISQSLGVSSGADAQAAIVVPMAARGRMVGAVTFGFSTRRQLFDPLFITTAKDLAGTAGLALDNSQLYEAACSAVQSRNEVLGIVSHDLRVPVHTIVATLSLLSDSMPERRSDVRKLFDILHRATMQIDHLIEDLLDMSRLEGKHFTIEPRQSNVVDMITEACETLRYLAAEKDITIEPRIDGEMPPVAADAPAVVRVIGNLLGNAIKFSPDGSTIIIHAHVADGELRVSIRDQGPGIAKDDLARVFDRFWQGEPRDRRGAGLGLGIARGIIEAHGGTIWVESEEENGSTFTFSLPLGTANVDRRAAAPAPTPADGPQHPVHDRGYPDYPALRESRLPPRRPSHSEHSSRAEHSPGGHSSRA